MLVAACVWAAAGEARAQEPKVVVLDFPGKGGGKARIQVIRALRDRVTFETKTAGEQVLASKGLSASSATGRAAVADALSVDYVIWGRVRGKGSSARAKIRFAGPEGKEIASRDAGPPGTAKGNARIQKAALALLAKALTAAPPVRETAAEDTKPAARPKPEPIVVPPVEVSTTEIDEPVAIEVKARSVTTRYAPHVLLLAGAGGRVRTVEIDIEDGAGGTGTRKYESGVYLDIVFRLELRPFARNAAKGLRGLALEADGAFGVGLETRPPGSSTPLDTKAWRVLGQLGYFHRFENGELGGLVGVGFDRLEIETNGTIPSIDYLFLRLGPAYRHFFIGRLLYLRVDGGFRWPFSYGQLEDAFGNTKGFGFDAALMLGGELDVGFSYGARLSFEYFKPQFSGFSAGVPLEPPAAAEGRDATDLGINFHAMVGWAF
jgi:hypothetical protein